MGGSLEQLKEAYHENKIVPFIGAGISVPFNIPTWGDLIRDITDEYAKGKIETMLRRVLVQKILDRNIECQFLLNC
ncbi:hypothetical protein [Bacillus mycoides]|uniref:hypothetical protein n=1 Tax=Bacillus mycoides TaxID=1405 RepID=UPI001C01A091|nr:hypothetical protein [Bacillus mycoides]QWH42846.1 hypothetical protein EXW53_26575 [Bacillus mycoides]